MVSPPPRKLAVLAASTGAVMAIGVVDWQTGVALRVFPLYFLPVAYTAWWLSRRYGVGMALAASVTWLVSNVSAETSDSDPLVWGFNVGAQLVAFVTVGLLVAGLRQRLLAEEELNRVDALTGLPNRRAFRERTEWLFSLMRREGRPITVAYVDLDNFKSVNDRHGHQEGDRALRLASEAMRKHLREGDVVARLGGDEFAVLLPNTSAEQARVALERLRSEVSKAMQAESWPITTSIGAVTFPEPPAEIDAALRRADERMYEAKREGKDRVTVVGWGASAGSLD